MGKGIFPQMSIPDIINALSGWGLSVSHEQLIRPSADFVESIYCACLQQVTDIDHEALRDPVQTALVACNPDDKVRLHKLFPGKAGLQLIWNRRIYMLPR